MNKSSRTAALSRLEKAQLQYEAAQEALKEADAALDILTRINSTMKPLMDYYGKHWLEDVDATEGEENRPPVSGEDGIWNLNVDHYELMKRLLAMSSEYFTKN